MTDDSGQPRLLFHYTDAKGLIGIVGDRRLWATDVFCLNDASEVTHLFDEVRLACDQLAQAELADGGQPTVAESIRSFGGIARAIATSNHGLTFVSCFCEKRDLLSQWARYGQGVGGYALGFDRQVLSGEGTVFPTPERISYEAFNQRDRFLKRIGEIAESRMPTSHGDQERTKWWSEVMAEFFREIVFQAPLYKSPGFSEECEWRGVVRSETFTPPIGLKFRSASSNPIIAYIELNLTTPDGAFPLKEIVIGPCPDSQLAKRNLTILLEANGIDSGAVEITVSSVPLRA